MPHSSLNSLLAPTTSGSPHTSKPLKPFAGTSSTSTSAPSTPNLESRPEALTNLKSDTHRYHKFVTAAKQKYYSSIFTYSFQLFHLWRDVNSILHRKSPSPLPRSIPSPSIADT